MPAAAAAVVPGLIGFGVASAVKGFKKAGRAGQAPGASPAPDPIPRKVEVDVAAAEKEERDIAGRRRGRNRSLITRGFDLGEANTSQSQLLGV